MTENEEVPNQIPNSDSKFKQQRLPALRPFLTPIFSAIIFFGIGILSLILAIIYLKTQTPILEYSKRYDNECNIGETCTVQIEIKEKMKKPIYVYYELSKVYQSNYMYESSKSEDQLRGKAFKNLKKLDSCEPMETNSSGNGPENVYVPCGALPMSVFNDTYTFKDDFPTVDTTNIASKNFKKKFKDADSSYNTGIHWMDTTLFPNQQTDEHFINWLMISAFDKFRKKWGKVDSDIEASTYSIDIDNRYDVSSFSGIKSIVISEVSWAGGRNSFFTIFFFILAGISIIISILLIILYLVQAFPLYKALEQEENGLLTSVIV